MKRHIELFLSGAPETSRIVDHAHFVKNCGYYDTSRKKKLGLNADEVPLPNMIVSFQACGPKNYQFSRNRCRQRGKPILNKVKHKGISKKIKETEEDYSSLIMLWDKQSS